MKTIKKNLVIILAVFLLSFNQNIFSQIKIINGIALPDNFIISDSNINTGNNNPLEKTVGISLPRLKGDFAVNSECGEFGSNQLYPDIAMGDNGNFICVWVDERTGAQEVLAQLYNAIGQKRFDLRQVSNSTMSWNVAPNVVYNKATKEYLITWAQDYGTIVLQRLDVNGNKIGNIQRVNDAYYCNTSNPSVATDKLGNIMVTWVSQNSSSCSGSSIVFVKLFDGKMNSISDQRTFMKDGERISSIGRDCRIASDTLGNFVVVWSGSDNDKSKIFLQKINTNQWLFEESKIVSENITGYFPTIASTADGYFLISWATEEDGVAGRIFNSDSGFVSKEFMIDKNKTSWSPHSTSSDEFNNFYCAVRSWDTRLIKLNKNGEFLDSLQIASTQLKNFSLPKLSEVTRGEFYAACYSSNKGDVDVAIHSFTSSLSPSGKDINIEDSCSSAERNPVVKFNKIGNSLVVWESAKDGNRNIYGQTYDEEFNATSGEFLISDSSKYNYTYRPKISSDNSGNYLITFANESYPHSIVFQKISSSGEKIGGNVKLSDNFEYANVISNTDKNDNTMFCWYDRSYSGTVVYQLFDSKSNSISSSKVLLTGDSKTAKTIKDVWVDEELNILVLWNEYDRVTNKSASKLNANIFNKDGEMLNDTIQVYSGTENIKYGYGKCRMDENGNTIFVWNKWNTSQSNSDLKTFVSRKYLSSNKTYIDSFYTNDYWHDVQIVDFSFGKSFIAYNSSSNINGYLFDDVIKKSVVVYLKSIIPYYNNPFDLSNNFGSDIFDNKLFLAYEQVKEKSKGIDIWANVQDYSKIYSELYRSNNTNTSIINIFTPYPNPVVSDFTLNYSVSKTSCVKFFIYNSIGQIVRELDFGVQYAGVYLEEIDVTNLSAGVYFIAGIDIENNVQKFVILK